MRRSSLGIILEMLELCQEPTRKTHILFTLRLNFDQLRKLLTQLMGKNMLEIRDGFVVTTDKGRTMLSMWS
jgi:predicted transcriptional regulator